MKKGIIVLLIAVLAVVEGATLALVYANDDFVAENKGAVTASCKISF